MKKEEEFFNKIMKASELKLQDSDFDDRIMAKIREKEEQKAFSTNIKLSWICFAIAIVIGITILSLLSQYQFSILGIRPKNVFTGIQVAFALFVLLQFDILLKYSRKITINFQVLKTKLN